MPKTHHEKLMNMYEQGVIDIAYLRRAAKKLNEEREQEEMKRKLTEEIIKSTEMERKIVALANRAPQMKYSEAKEYGFLAKAVVNKIVREVKDDITSLELLEQYLQDELTGGEIEKIVQDE